MHEKLLGIVRFTVKFHYSKLLYGLTHYHSVVGFVSTHTALLYTSMVYALYAEDDTVLHLSLGFFPFKRL